MTLSTNGMLGCFHWYQNNFAYEPFLAVKSFTLKHSSLRPCGQNCFETSHICHFPQRKLWKYNLNFKIIWKYDNYDLIEYFGGKIRSEIILAVWFNFETFEVRFPCSPPTQSPPHATPVEKILRERFNKKRKKTN